MKSKNDSARNVLTEIVWKIGSFRIAQYLIALLTTVSLGNNFLFNWTFIRRARRMRTWRVSPRPTQLFSCAQARSKKRSRQRRNGIRCRSALPDPPPRRHSGRGSRRCVSSSLRLSEKAARTSLQSKTTLGFAEIGILASITPATSLPFPLVSLSASETGRETREDKCLCTCLWDMGLTLRCTIRSRTPVYCQGMLVNLTREVPTPRHLSPKNSCKTRNYRLTE